MNKASSILFRTAAAIAAVCLLTSCAAGEHASSSSTISSSSSNAASQQEVESSSATVSGQVESVEQSSSASEQVSSSQSQATSSAPSVEQNSYVEMPTPTAEENFQRYGHNGNTPTGYPILNGTRNAWDWPFSRDSIWNMPIGSRAKYSAANIKKSWLYLIDTEYIYKTTSSDPQLDIYAADMNNRWPDVSTCKKYAFKTYWPKNVTISKSLTGNCCSAILQPDSRTVIQLQPTCRENKDSDYITGIARETHIDLYGDGRIGTHWGSGLSTLGGSIRLGELTSDEPIRHALKLDVYGKQYLYYSNNYPGFKWPATNCDSGAAKGGYGGTNQMLVQGALLAIEPGVTAEQLGIKTEVGKKLFWTLQNYGCYIVDDSGCDAHNLCAQEGVVQEVKKKYGYSMTGDSKKLFNSKDKAYYNDLMALITNLSIVTNNAKNNVGGGGTPRQPLAPNLEAIN